MKPETCAGTVTRRVVVAPRDATHCLQTFAPGLHDPAPRTSRMHTPHRTMRTGITCDRFVHYFIGKD
jgi:hypothetical protein